MQTITTRALLALATLILAGESCKISACPSKASETPTGSGPSSSAETNNNENVPAREALKSSARQFSDFDPYFEDRAKEIEQATRQSSQSSSTSSSPASRSRGLYGYSSPNQRLAAYRPAGNYRATGSYLAQQAGTGRAKYGNSSPVFSWARAKGYTQKYSGGYGAPVNGPQKQYGAQQQQAYQEAPPKIYQNDVLVLPETAPAPLYDNLPQQQPRQEPVVESVIELEKPDVKVYSTYKKHTKNREGALKTIVNFKESKVQKEPIQPDQVIQPEFYVQEETLPVLLNKYRTTLNPKLELKKELLEKKAEIVEKLIDKKEEALSNLASHQEKPKPLLVGPVEITEVRKSPEEVAMEEQRLSPAEGPEYGYQTYQEPVEIIETKVEKVPEEDPLQEKIELKEDLIKKKVDFIGDLVEKKKEGKDELIKKKVDFIGDLVEKKKEAKEDLIKKKVDFIGDLVEKKKEAKDELVEQKADFLGKLVEGKKKAKEDLIEGKVDFFSNLLAEKKKLKDELINKKVEFLSDLFNKKKTAKEALVDELAGKKDDEKAEIIAKKAGDFENLFDKDLLKKETSQAHSGEVRANPDDGETAEDTSQKSAENDLSSLEQAPNAEESTESEEREENEQKEPAPSESRKSPLDAETQTVTRADGREEVLDEAKLQATSLGFPEGNSDKADDEAEFDRKLFELIRNAENKVGDFAQKVEQARANGLEGKLLKKEQEQAVKEFKEDQAKKAANGKGARGATKLLRKQ